MKEAHPEMLVGAGTVLTVDQVDCAVQAGAEFIVSPGFDPEIVDYCIKKKTGTSRRHHTIWRRHRQYERTFRNQIFPAEQAGGLAFIKAMAALYTSFKFYANRRNQSRECKNIWNMTAFLPVEEAGW